MVIIVVFCVFFFKQKTAYEVRISDWSSDVCSSDLHATRGSQVAYAHPQGYQIVQALKEFDVIADFRAPDILRFGLTPLYLRYRDIVETTRRLEKVCATRAWDKPRSEEHTSELQSLMRISYAVFCLKKTKKNTTSTIKT